MNVVRGPVKCTVATYRKALSVLVLQPHAVDKSVLGADICFIGSVAEGLSIFDSWKKDSVSKDWAKIEFDETKLIADNNQAILRSIVYKRNTTGNYIMKGSCYQVSQMQLVLWSAERSVLKVTTLNKASNSVMSSVDDDYGLDLSIEFDSSIHELLITFNDPSMQCLMKRMLQSLTKWCSESNLSIPKQSQRLVALDAFHNKYIELKAKYAPQLAQNWTESTDPSKFIHEDVSLASYIILLWAKEPTKPSFIDLGCGNGLLVYILTKEGYLGTGVDIRPRKIWSLLHEADLKVETVIPSVSSRYPSYDWLIGNHSDELTPWLPVMAALTSYASKFFLLPCCPFELTGSKFRRRNNKESLYRDYLDYVKEVTRSSVKIISTHKRPSQS